MIINGYKMLQNRNLKAVLHGVMGRGRGRGRGRSLVAVCVSPLATPAPIFGCPFDALGINSDLPLHLGLAVLLEGLVREADNVLATIVLD